MTCKIPSKLPEHETRHSDEKDCETGLHIFVNKRHFDEHYGVKRKMKVEEIAKLVGWSHQEVKVRFTCPRSEETGEPLVGEVEIVNGDHFIVTRCNVVGGYIDRVNSEMDLLIKAGQEVKLLPAPFPCLIYINVLTPTGNLIKKTDIMVPIPISYPASMIDRVALPEGSPLIGKLKGAPQETVIVDGVMWRLVSYHPHTNGGAGPWQPSVHGFHTYYGEVLSWLGDC